MKMENENLQKTMSLTREHSRAETRADGKTTRPKTKRCTHWSKCVTMRETELNFSKDEIKIRLRKVEKSL